MEDYRAAVPAQHGRRGRTTPMSRKASWRDVTWTNCWSEPGQQPHRRPADRAKTDKTTERPTTLSGPGDTEHSWQHKVGYRQVEKQHVGLNMSTMTDLGLASLHRAAVNSWWCVMTSDVRWTGVQINTAFSVTITTELTFGH